MVKNHTIGVVGATGLVGRMILDILPSYNLVDPDYEVYAAASDASVGQVIETFSGQSYTVIGVDELLEKAPGVVLFAVEAPLATEWAPRFAEAGSVVIDNSSAFRMDEDVPLVIPEVNPHAIRWHSGIISNPNCSTIQLIVALNPLHQVWGLDTVRVSTYQAVSGSGVRGLNQLASELKGEDPVHAIYPHPIADNCLPHCDDFEENGYTKEELKLVNESRKILEEPGLRISATAVRVPVSNGHSEAVSVIFRNPVSVLEAREILSEAPGVWVADSPYANQYPMPYMACGGDSVYVGRIREDLASPGNGLLLWVVADNLRKGAALNAVQIARLLFDADSEGE